MTALLIIFVLVIAAFTFVLTVGAPYLPTLKKSRTEALRLLDLKPGQTLFELGCGDGSLMILAAKKGLNVVGYEINPILALVSYVRTLRYRKQVKVVCGNFWSADLTKADGVYVFLLERFMDRIDAKLELASKTKPIKFVSNAFQVKSRQPLEKSGTLFLYIYG